jgi:hypothetical protein
MKLTEFLDKHQACKEGRDWAIETGCQTIEELWLRSDIIPDWRMWIARRVLPTKTIQIFACKAARSIWHLLKDERSKNAIVIAELFLDGEATIEQLIEARAYDAAYAAADAATYAADAANYAAAAAYAADYAADYTADYAADYAADAADAAANYAATAAYAAACDADYAADAADAADADYDAARKQKWDQLTAILMKLAPTITVEE